MGTGKEGWEGALLAFSSDEETEAQRGEGNRDKPTQLADLSGHRVRPSDSCPQTGRLAIWFHIPPSSKGTFLKNGCDVPVLSLQVGGKPKRSFSGSQAQTKGIKGP